MFEIKDYKKIISDRISALPNHGRGEWARLARKLRVAPVVVSQIFRGSRDLTMDQALLVATHFTMSEIETEYFLLLVQSARAATPELRKRLNAQIDKIRSRAKEIKERVSKSQTVSDNVQAEFYSDWLYSGTRLKAGIETVQTYNDLLKSLPDIERQRIDNIWKFLREYGFVEESSGNVQIGIQSTHLGSDSPHVNNHRRNWRIKALERLVNKEPSDLFYSGPMVLSAKDRLEFREELVSLIAKFTKRVAASECEQTACLNIDWFGF